MKQSRDYGAPGNCISPETEGERGEASFPPRQPALTSPDSCQHENFNGSTQDVGSPLYFHFMTSFYIPEERILNKNEPGF